MHLAWDVLIVIVILWNVTLGIYYHSFVERHDSRACAHDCFDDPTAQGVGLCDECDYSSEYTTFAWLGYLGDACFIMDVVVNFRTAVVVNVRGNKVFIKDMRAVSVNYFRSFFFVDLLGIGVPFGLISLVAKDPTLGSEGFEGIYQITYVAGIFKILRLFRLNALLKRLYNGTVEFQK